MIQPLMNHEAKRFLHQGLLFDHICPFFELNAPISMPFTGKRYDTQAGYLQNGGVSQSSCLYRKQQGWVTERYEVECC